MSFDTTASRFLWPTDLQRLPGAQCDDPHVDAGGLAKLGQQVAEQARLLGGGGRRETAACLGIADTTAASAYGLTIF